MILPEKQPETVNLSSTFEDTLFDSSIQRQLDGRPKRIPAMSSESQEVVFEDNLVLNQLSYHISGDAFTSSRLNSPVEPNNHVTPMHVDVETIIQPITSKNIQPQILENIHETQIPEQQIEMSQENPLSDLDASTIFNIEHNIPLSPISIETIPLDSPPTESDALIIHPLYKHLTMDEIVIPSDQILPILKTLTRNSIDIESSSELIHASALRKITIKPLKHQKSSPKPKLPYKKPYQFFNQNFEPILELLTSVIHIGRRCIDLPL
jgi:hypothetical protein